MRWLDELRLRNSEAVLILSVITGLLPLYLIIIGIVKLVKLLANAVGSLVNVGGERILAAKKNKYLKDLQEYHQDYKDGYLTKDEFKEIVEEYNRKDKRIEVRLK